MTNRSVPKAILFDLDDTILAYGSVSDRCWQEICQRFDERIENVDGSRLLEAIRSTSRWFWSDPERHRMGRLKILDPLQEIVTTALAGLGVADQSISDEIAVSYSKIREEGVAPFPGAIETVKHLRNDGIRLALITNGSSESQRSKINRFRLGPLFECILIEGEFGVGKPDQRVYRHALDQLESNPSDTWMVGDNLEWDVGAPQNLGITGIWVDPNGKGLPDTTNITPDRIIKSLPELL